MLEYSRHDTIVIGYFYSIEVLVIITSKNEKFLIIIYIIKDILTLP